MKAKRQITGGLYLVADFRIPDIVEKVRCALEGGVDVLQLWAITQQDETRIRNIKAIAHAHQVPVLAHESISAFREYELDGIHFDNLPPGFDRKNFDNAIIGVTGSNDVQRIEHALNHAVNYISFCAIYPSLSSISCELISPGTIRSVRAKTEIPLFGSGGITPQRVRECLESGLNGVAVISGILAQGDPAEAAKKYREAIMACHTTSIKSRSL